MTGSTLCLLAVLAAGPASADSTAARCDIYPAGEDHADVTIPCRFYQAQGHVVITRSDGIEHDLLPQEGMRGEFVDQHGDRVYRDDDLGQQGLIFRFPEESVYVYWNTASLDPAGDRQPYEPAADLNFDATAWTRCRKATETTFGQCPSGVLRMDNGEGSVVIENPPGQTFTINFLRDYVNATNGEVEAVLEGDSWIVTINGEDVYEVPRAFIEGG